MERSTNSFSIKLRDGVAIVLAPVSDNEWASPPRSQLWLIFFLKHHHKAPRTEGLGASDVVRLFHVSPLNDVPLEDRVPFPSHRDHMGLCQVNVILHIVRVLDQSNYLSVQWSGQGQSLEWRWIYS